MAGEADFAIAVEQWVAKAKSDALLTFRQIALDMTTRVKELTPVKTGFLRANWVDLLNDDAEPTASGSPTFGYAISLARLGDVIHITNPVRYALRIEFGFVGVDSLGRHYNQLGHGMVAQTFVEAPQIADEAVMKIAAA